MSERRVRTLDIAGDLGSLPLPPEALWVRTPRRTSGWWQAAEALGIIAALFAVALPLTFLVAQDRGGGDVANRAAGVTQTPRTDSSVSAAAALPLPPFCTTGSPLLDISLPPPPGDSPGTGAASPEEAFRKAFPGTTDFAMFPLDPNSRSRTAPVWIIAEGKTFIATFIGSASVTSSWFAYPARFVRCRSVEEIQNQPHATPPASGAAGS